MNLFKQILFLFLGALVLSSCSSDIENMVSDSVTTKAVSSEEWGEKMILGAHKCNEIEKLQDAIDYGISNFEVDIHVSKETGVPILMIGHELETSTGQTFGAYMDDLLIMKPDFNFLWLDFKDLNSRENEAIISETLNRLDEKYSIKHRVLVESRYIEYLTSFANEGWHVSFYSTWSSLKDKTEQQQKEICESWLASMNEYNVDGISFDAEVYQAMNDNFGEAYVNGKKVKQYSWNYRIYYNDNNLEQELEKYNHLAVLIIGFPNEEIPKLVMNVNFDKGFATNMGEEISSLPIGTNGANEITVQWNSILHKYEAIFDGTNFYYIPYEQNDLVGEAMKNMFSMVILFSPDDGVNPFSSMESGGLGYELTSNDELAFYYRANNKWVSPNDQFLVPIQVGQGIYYHAVVTYDKSTLKMYIDGLKVREMKVSGTFNFPKKENAASYLFGIGGDYRDSVEPSVQNAFVGKIVYAQLYKGILSDTDIKELYAQ